MLRAIDVQFLGSAIVIGAFASAEAAVRYLDACPASPLAWYLNLRVFGLFEAGRMPGSALAPLFGPDALAGALGLLAVLVLLRLLRARFGLALAANLSFVATLFLAGAVLRSGAARAQAVSLDAVSFGSAAILPPDGNATLAALLAASFTAFVASHLAFVRAVGRDARRRSAIRSRGGAAG